MDNKEKIKLKREVFKKKDFKKSINVNFEELIDPQPDPSFFDINLATIEDFFVLYEKLFYDIPKEGNNSHEFLVESSGEYINFERDNKEIKELIDEITQLRTENLELYKKIIDVTGEEGETRSTTTEPRDYSRGGDDQTPEPRTRISERDEEINETEQNRLLH